MVDTVPYTKALTPQRLSEILLGTLHPSIKSAIAEKSSTAVKECPICCSDDIPEYEYPRFPPTSRCQHKPLASSVNALHVTLSRSCFPKLSSLRSVAQVILVKRSLATTRSSNGPLLTASNGNTHCFIGPLAHDLSRYNSMALRQRLAEDVNFRWCLNVKCDHGQTHPHGGLHHFVLYVKNLMTSTM